MNADSPGGIRRLTRRAPDAASGPDALAEPAAPGAAGWRETADAATKPGTGSGHPRDHADDQARDGADLAAPRRPGWVVQGVERFAVVGVWIAMAAVYAALRPGYFATAGTVQTILDSQAPLVFLCMALLCSIVIGEFLDLSVASVLGLSATIVPVLAVLHHVNVVLASAVAIGAGLAAGLVNAVLIVVVGVNAIVVTLGMSTFLLGVALWISNLNTISGLSTSFSDVANASFGGLPASFYYGIVLTLAFAYILWLTPLGRHMRFVGANREVSRLAGIRVNRIRFLAFVFSALISSVGGVVVTAGLGGFNPQDSAVYLLPTFAAIFLGTAVIQPGEFNPIGTLVGIYFLETGIVGLEELGYGGWIADVFYGAVLVAAVTISTIVRRRTRGIGG
jgi:ribose transport system permease protein